MSDAINQYLTRLTETFKTGQATEPSYYAHVKDFLEKYFEQKGKKISVITHPKKIGNSMPDMLIKAQDDQIIGYIEAKDVDETDLRKVTQSEQLTRYQGSLPNFVLTNFTEFILFRNGKLLKQCQLADVTTLLTSGKTPKLEDPAYFDDLVDIFVSYIIPEIVTAKTLAIELAKRAKLLRDAILETLETEQTELANLHSLLEKNLVPGLTKEKFADIYGQTVAYGLFFAKEHSGSSSFSRLNAINYIPNNIPVLRNLFYLLNYPNQAETLKWILDDIVAVLNRTAFKSVMKDIHTKTWTADPVVHFYETFLGEYDPELKERAGVFFTPMPVVLYIVKSVDKVLRNHFGCSMGLLSPEVKVLDPAAGTLTFLTASMRVMHKNLDDEGNAGMFAQIVQKHLLKNFFAFEQLFAPYAVGHFKAGVILEDLGYRLSENERLQFYLTDTLDFSEVQQMPLFPDLASEVEYANKVKKEIPILAIVGNPPYSTSAKVSGDFINGLMKDYTNCLGVEKEAKKGALQDDYIRFIRFAHWKIDLLGRGVLAFITNNSYLDGIIHRCMRRRLLDSFDKIYILNVHGNAWQRETAEDGSPDENVFDIKQGVAICILIKTGGKRTSDEIWHRDLFGSRQSKYRFLETHDISTTDWKQIKVQPPQLSFALQAGEDIIKRFRNFASILSIFDVYGRCVTTSRDEFVTDFDRDVLQMRLETFANPDISDEEIIKKYGVKDGFDWSMNKARKKYISQGMRENSIQRYHYRPFDHRLICYDDILVSRSLRRVNEHLCHNNLGLCVVRQYAYNKPYSHFLITNALTDDRVFVSNRGQAYLFPLYLYRSDSTKTSNIRQSFKTIIETIYGEYADEESFCFYCYAIFYSRKYRSKYKEPLSKEFPRVPLTSKLDVYKSLKDLGERLTNLHTFKIAPERNNMATFPIVGSDIVTKVSFDHINERVYINDEQYFEKVGNEVWNYYIGGYMVLEKFLKSRLKRKLTREEMETAQRIVGIIKETMAIEEQIDPMYDLVEQDLFEYKEKNEVNSTLFPAET